MSKRKALTSSILFALTALAFYIDNNPLFMNIAIIAMILFAIVWYSKYSRDIRILNKAQRDSQAPAQVSHAIPQVSEGSRRLFVPPPLKDK